MVDEKVKMLNCVKILCRKIDMCGWKENKAGKAH